MLGNTITLSGVALYDTDGETPLTAGDIVYDRITMRGPDKVEYQGPNHVEGVQRDLLHLTRSYAKRSGNSLGVRRCTAKFTRDVEVSTADGGTVKAPAIGEVSFALPQGVTVQDSHNLRKLVTELCTDMYNAVLNRMMDKLEI